MQATIRPGVVIGLLLVMAFGLRVYQSGRYGLYLDEKYTLIISQGVVMEGANQRDVFFTPGKTTFTPREFWKPKTVGDFIEANIRGDIGNSPAYYGVLWVWMEVFGLGDFAARFPSVLFSTLLVGLLYWFVRRHFRSESLALLSAFLATIEPFFVAYSHMARNYSMSFLLTLLASHLFLLLVERLGTNRPTRWLYVGYGLTVVVSLLSHYLTVIVFLCHGLYLLLYVRPPRRWLGFASAGAGGLSLTAIWFVFGGGKYTFQTLAYQAQLYRQMALTNPVSADFGTVLPATLVNVVTRSLPIATDLFIVSNGLGQVDALGVRNLGLALGLGLVAVWLLYRQTSTRPLPGWTLYLYPVLLLAGLPLYTVPNLQFVVVATLPTWVWLLTRAIRQHAPTLRPPLLVLVGLLTVMPTLFLVVMAVKNGHTYGITQRYSGFSFPYAIILIALAVRQVVQLPTVIRLTLTGVLLLQGYFVARLLVDIYRDQAPKYTYFSVPRIANPYAAVADQIKAQYAPGDTIVYPSVRMVARDAVEKTYSPYSVQDAQLTNLYLPHEATYVQRMDTTEVNRIRLVTKKTGQVRTLFDFRGRTYRY